MAESGVLSYKLHSQVSLEIGKQTQGADSRSQGPPLLSHACCSSPWQRLLSGRLQQSILGVSPSPVQGGCLEPSKCVRTVAGPGLLLAHLLPLLPAMAPRGGGGGLEAT